MMFRKCLLSCVLLSVASASVFSQEAKPEASPESKSTAPAFSLTSLDGRKYELASLRGKVVVLNFWFTGCHPCIEEMPELNKLVDKFKERDVVFLAPALDDEATLKVFLKDHAFKYNVVPGAGGMIIVTYSDGTGNVSFPTHIVIDREGRIDTRFSGGLITKEGTKRLKDLRDTIERLTDSGSDKTK